MNKDLGNKLRWAAAMAIFVFQGAVFGAAVTDEEIERSVENRLKIDPRVSVQELAVDSVNGAVRLSGTVDTLLDKEQAREVAQSVEGVQSVEDRIQVKTFNLPDSAVLEEIQRATQVIPKIDREAVVVNVENSVVILTGFVDSAEKVDWFTDAAKDVKGVKKVRNNIAIRP